MSGVEPDDRLDAIDVALHDVHQELMRAIQIHPPFNSSHEGWAVIFEELDELWDEVKANRGRGENARTEAMQTAAMAIRYMAELTEP